MELSLAKNTKFYIAPHPPLYVWEERVLPIETPPSFDEVGIPLLVIN
jgi:hypothetical protein